MEEREGERRKWWSSGEEVVMEGEFEVGEEEGMIRRVRGGGRVGREGGSGVGGGGRGGRVGGGGKRQGLRGGGCGGGARVRMGQRKRERKSRRSGEEVSVGGVGGRGGYEEGE